MAASVVGHQLGFNAELHAFRAEVAIEEAGILVLSEDALASQVL